MRFRDGIFQFSATDLQHFMHCNHLTIQDKAVSLGEKQRPGMTDPFYQLITERGRHFEHRYIQYLKGKGLEIAYVTEANGNGKLEFKTAVERTIEAMQGGADIILQGYLHHGDWSGYADFLRKIDQPSKWGDWAYEVLDAKLAMETRAGSVLQLCNYTEMLGKVQEYIPENMYIIKPGKDRKGFDEDTFRFADFAAYYRKSKQDMHATIVDRSDSSYPHPAEYCEQCIWWSQCENRRRTDDHLVYIAGISQKHMNELHDHGLDTLALFAKDQLNWRPQRGRKESYQKLQKQAQIQEKGRMTENIDYEILSSVPGKGLNILPEPDPGDLFFDIEADRFIEDGGLQYLLGYAYLDKRSELVYKGLWSFDKKQEKENFEQFMDFVTHRFSSFPNMHIYHFAPYEEITLKKLSNHYDTKGVELDQILRRERLIDLHQVIKQSVRASVESYSLKELERFYHFKRHADLKKAASALRYLQKALEFSDELPQKDVRDLVENYNREDCISTFYLRKWSEQLRSEAIYKGLPIQRPKLKFEATPESIQIAQDARKILCDQLLTGIPDEQNLWSMDENERFLMAHLLGYFNREWKASIWEYYHLQELGEEELYNERKAIAGLVKDEWTGKDKKSILHRYWFPDQELGLKSKDKLEDLQGLKIGEVNKIDFDQNFIYIKKRKDSKGLHPSSCITTNQISDGLLENALMEIGRQILHDPSKICLGQKLLRKSLPAIRGVTSGSPVYQNNENLLQAAIRCSLGLSESILSIQGPPGAGKTYIGSRIVLVLKERGYRVGVTALSHKAIMNLLEGISKAASENKQKILLVHRGEEKNEDLGIEKTNDNSKAQKKLGEEYVVGATVFFWSRIDLKDQLDYLLVDEAGQLSLAHVMAATQATKNLILMGDPQQLEQPQQAAHPEGTHLSALEHLLNGMPTVSSDQGIFLDRTYRMHPFICQITSELFYESKLKSITGLENQKIVGKSPFGGSGLFYVPTPHNGNSSKSFEEIEKVKDLVSHLTQTGLKWQTKVGEQFLVTKDSIMIIAPYNAQVTELKKVLPGFDIGTVDKFQGREAPIVIFSMTSSSAEDAPRGMGFLYHPNRLNVASSRAKCTFVLVSSPMVFEVACATPEQMRWANGYCRFLELAKEIEFL